MKRIFELIFTATAMFSLAACTSNELVSPDDAATTHSSDSLPINFGVYTSANKTSRAGVGGAIDTEKLKDCGFGVFAAYTGTTHYDDMREDWYNRYEILEPYEDEEEAMKYKDMFNYMLNEKVTYQGGAWKCGVTKYWPNPTITDATGVQKSQYVSFIAYAPYIPLIEYGDEDRMISPGSEETYTSESGIRSFVLNITYYDRDNFLQSPNPKIEYSSVPVKNNNEASEEAPKQVDLLWGTAGNNGKSWDGKDQEGENYPILESTHGGAKAEDNTNTGFNVNVDLTKMTTDGNVSFNFKHTLASLGGNMPNGTTQDNSLTIDAINDVVRADGSETNYDGSDRNNSTTGLKDDNRISVNWIVIEVKDNYGNNNNINYSQGQFDLVTGEWYLDDSEGSPIYYVIGKKSDNNDTQLKNIVKNGLGESSDKAKFVFTSLNDNVCLTNDGKTYDQLVGDVNDKFTWNDGVKYGVTTTKQNPCAENSDPYLFIPDQNGYPRITVAVDYDIISPDKAYDTDGSTHKGYTIAHQIQKSTVNFSQYMKINTKYNLHLHLGVNSMKLDANVSDWTSDTQDVDLPANVSPGVENK